MRMHRGACGSAALTLLAGVLVVPVAAKPRPVPTCAARFPAAGVGLAGVPAETLDAVAIDGTGVTVSSACGSVTARPKRTKAGWKFRTHWRPCGATRKVALAATVDQECTTLRGLLRLRRPKRRLAVELRVASCDRGTAFESTFQGIQSAIFERHGCTAQACHGAAPGQGGLALSPAVAYRNLLQAKSSASAFNRVEPGDQRRSFLWLKLAAATDPPQPPPGGQVAGAPMPNGLAPLSADELELMRLWIYNGAPETGTVAGTEPLLKACLPIPKPILIEPLSPPPPGRAGALA